MQAFRSIRRGVQQVVKDSKVGSFGNDFKGTSLEVVLGVIAEQKQVFQGAAHPFQHTEMQYQLLRVGKALGCDVTTAINDRNRLYQS